MYSDLNEFMCMADRFMLLLSLLQARGTAECNLSINQSVAQLINHFSSPFSRKEEEHNATYQSINQSISLLAYQSLLLSLLQERGTEECNLLINQSVNHSVSHQSASLSITSSLPPPGKNSRMKPINQSISQLVDHFSSPSTK